MTSSATPGAFEYRPALDGVRAVAVYLVVMFHARGSLGDEPIARHGFIGVDLFFVLSGFIVTSVLLSEHAANGTISLRRFYARRVRRLLPAAVVCIVTTAAIFVLVASLYERLDYVADARAALLYVANWHFVAESNDYFALNVENSPYLHFWSLAIEEQFYVLFPLMLLGLTALQRRGHHRAVPVGLGVVAAASVASQLYWRSADASWAYYGTDARMYQLMAGALLAVAIGGAAAPLVRRSGPWLAPAGLVAIVALGFWPDALGVSERGLLATVSSVALIAGLEGARSSVTARALSAPSVVYLGTISYATYLWHWPIALASDRLLQIGPGASTIVVATAATSVAALSQRLLELPLRSSRRLDRIPVPVVATGIATSIVCAAVVVPPVLESSRAPSIAAAPAAPAAAPDDVTVPAEPVADADDRVPADIDWNAVRRTRADIPTCPVDEPEGCITRQGDGPHVVLVGNSVARSFVPAFEDFAEREGWTLTVNVQQGCAWLPPLRRADGDQDDECDERRTPWYRDVLPRIEPDVVVLLQGTDRNTASLIEGRWLRADEELDAIAASGARIVLIDGYPITPEPSPTECLSQSVSISACAFDLTDGTLNPQVPLLAARRADSDMVPLTPLVCPGLEVCPAMIDGVVVWRDPRHLSDLFIPVIQDELLEQLLATGAFDVPGG